MNELPLPAYRSWGERPHNLRPAPNLAPVGPMISLSGLRRSFTVGDENVEVLKGVDLRIFPGEFVVISGESGSGKSTLLRILGLLDTDFTGDFVVNGEQVRGRAEWWLDEVRTHNIGFVFQEGRLFSHRTIEDNIHLPQRMGAGSFSAALAAAEMQRWKPALFTSDELEKGLLDRRPEKVSGGQRQRAAICRSVVAGPSIILADEPTASLDSARKGQILELLYDLTRHGRTVVVVSHDEVFRNVGRQLVMRNGLLYAVKPNEEVNDGAVDDWAGFVAPAAAAGSRDRPSRRTDPPPHIRDWRGPSLVPNSEDAPSTKVLPLNTEYSGAASWWGWRPRAKLTALAQEVYREVFHRPLFLLMILSAVLAGVCQFSVFTSLMLGAEEFLEYSVKRGSRINRLEFKPRQENLEKDDVFPDRGEIAGWQHVERVIARREMTMRLVDKNGERLNVQVLGLHPGDPEFKLLPFEAGTPFSEAPYQLEIVVTAGILAELFDDSGLRDGTKRFSDYIGRTVVVRIPRFAAEGVLLGTTDVRLRVAGIVAHGEGRLQAYLPNSTLRIFDQAVRERKAPPVTPEGDAWTATQSELDTLANYAWEQRLHVYAGDIRQVVGLFSRLSQKGYRPVSDIWNFTWVFDIKEILTRVLLPLLIAVAVVMLVSLYSNIEVGARLREKELALWRILGMRKGDLILTQLTATLVIVTIATLGGLLLAHALIDYGAQIMHEATKTSAIRRPTEDALPIHMIFSPIKEFAPWVLAATLLFGLLAAFRPARKAAQTSPIRILQE